MFDKTLDNILQHIVNGRNDYDRTLFWRGRRGDKTWTAVRDGSKKLVRRTEAGQTEEWLFDLNTDAKEQVGLLSVSDRTRLQEKLKSWEAEMDVR